MKKCSKKGCEGARYKQESFCKMHKFAYNKQWYSMDPKRREHKTQVDKELRELKGTTYTTWKSMRLRCYYTKHEGYIRYGAKGVTVCDRWDTFSNFVEDMGLRPKGKTLDRIDPYGNYTPDNCRWATPRQQQQNRREK